MGYFLAFGVILIGYTVLDWGHYVQRHEGVSLWWLVSGKGNKYGGKGTSSASGASGFDNGSPAASAGGGNEISPGGGSW